MPTPTTKPPAERLTALRRRAIATTHAHRSTYPDPAQLTCNACGPDTPWPCDAYTIARTIEPLILAIQDGLAACDELQAETRLLSPVHLSPYRDAARKVAAVMEYRLEALPTVKETPDE